MTPPRVRALVTWERFDTAMAGLHTVLLQLTVLVLIIWHT